MSAPLLSAWNILKISLDEAHKILELLFESETSSTDLDIISSGSTPVSAILPAKTEIIELGLPKHASMDSLTCSIVNTAVILRFTLFDASFSIKSLVDSP